MVPASEPDVDMRNWVSSRSILCFCVRRRGTSQGSLVEGRFPYLNQLRNPLSLHHTGNTPSPHVRRFMCYIGRLEHLPFYFSKVYSRTYVYGSRAIIILDDSL